MKDIVPITNKTVEQLDREIEELKRKSDMLTDWVLDNSKDDECTEDSK